MSTSAERGRAYRARMTPAERTRERLFYARRRREDLIRAISPTLTCGICGCQFKVAELFVDHRDGVSFDRSRMSPHQRVARYFREFLSGVPMRALCISCSSSDGARWRGRARYRTYPSASAPSGV